MLAEYHEGEFKSAKEQETLLYAKRAVGATALTFLARTRINDFQTQTDYLPQVGYNLFSYPVLEIGSTSLYLDLDWEAAPLRRRFDDDLRLRDRDAVRIDLDNTVGLPIHLGPLKLEPFAGLRYTWYDEGALRPDALARVGTTYGVRLTSQFWRSFDVEGGLFGLRGLRHVVLPEIEYRAIDHVSREVDDYIAFDRVDAFSEREEIRFGIRNRFQTLREIDGRDEVVDFIDLDLEWTYFPQADRDNFGEPAGNLDLDLIFRPTAELVYLLDFEYSFVLDTFEIFNTTLGYRVTSDLVVAGGYRRYAGVNDLVFALASWRVDERLGLQLRTGYDFSEQRFQDQRLTVQRIGEDWVFEFEIDYDDGRGLGFSVSFTPRALFDPRQRFSPLRQEPSYFGFGESVLR